MREHPGIAAVAGAWIVGILLGAEIGWLSLWFVCAVLLTTMALWRRHRALWLGAIVTCGAAWYVVRCDYTAENDVGRYVGSESHLVRVAGVVEGPIVFSSPWRGAMGMFTYHREPNTLAVLRVERVMDQQASGKLLLRVRELDQRLAVGRRIEATGWLFPVRSAMNPGELDYRRQLREQGIEGQISLARTDNWKDLGEAPLRWALPRWSSAAGSAAEQTLNIGMENDSVQLALLQTLLLGRWSRELDGLDDTFRDVGLAHMLSISGAHLGILLGLVWLICRLLMVHPARSAMVVLVVLGLFMLAVPPRVPIVRAGIMAGLLCGAVWWGKRIDVRQTLALAALIVLIWRPSDLYNAGFQLSFLVVAALILFTGPLLERIWPAEWIMMGQPGIGVRVLRWVLGYAIASTVAFAVALPLVAYHYSMVNPLAVLLSLLALPALTAVLAIGYAKILFGLISPSISLMLSGPLRWVTDAMLGLVNEAHDWPGATLRLSGEPSAVWSLGVLAVIWFTLAGMFRGRRKTLIAAWCIAAGWTLWMQLPPLPRPLLQVNALAVGDGSCFLVRSHGRTLMFDCGSQRYMDVGLRSVSPALQTLGVRRIDVMVISHSDLDHYCGMLDVADKTPVREVWLTPQLLTEAREKPDGATAFLLEGLTQRGATLRVVTAGERADLTEQVSLNVLWPAGDYQPRVQNDGSIVLAIQAGDRRALLTGDIQQDAITRLLESGIDLEAGIMDLPHHGSIVEATGDLLDAVEPRFVLQSCGPDRRRDEDWAGLLQPRSIRRCVTDCDGMIEISLFGDGSMRVETFRQGAGEF
ncbi:MAG: ComEC/Rec2 family competence protein [Phycisphaeraceae bacterium]|nr:ComEC/Rec2 family competence protein [Phycisphaeraceae bacterium]